MLTGAAALIAAPALVGVGAKVGAHPGGGAVRFFRNWDEARRRADEGGRFILPTEGGGAALYENAGGKMRLLVDLSLAADRQGEAPAVADGYLEQFGGAAPAGEAGHDIDNPSGAVIVGQRIWNRAKPGISYGKNEHLPSRSWPPIRAIGNDIRNIGGPGAIGSKYGIISYAPHSIICANFVSNGRNANRPGDDVDGIYVKSEGAIVSDNVVVDFCQTEGAFNIKGSKRSDRAAPIGSEVNLSNNLAVFTDRYNREVLAAGGNTHGIKYANDGIRSQGFTCINASGNSVHTLGNVLADLQLTEHYSYNAGRNAFGLYASGSGLVVRNSFARDTADSYFYIGGQTEAADYLLDGGRCENAARGFVVRPSLSNAISLRIRNHHLQGVAGEILLVEGGGCRRLDIENVTADHGQREFIRVNAPVGEIRWIDSGPSDFQTSSDAPVSFLRLPLPAGRVAHLRCSFLGDDGTDHFAREFTAVLSGRGVDATDGTSQELSRSATPGASKWDASLSIDTRHRTAIILLRGGTAARPVRWACLEIRYQSV